MNRVKNGILIVDDDPFVGEMLAVILDDEGYVVKTAENGNEALDMVGDFRELALVISDMNMPGMSGVELMAKVRAASPGMPFIILTGSNETVAAPRGECAADDYLVKDEDIQDTICLAVEKVLAKVRG